MYEKPMFFTTDDFAEGIYLKSGNIPDNCWQYTGWRPDGNYTKQDNYPMHVDFKHINTNHYNAKDPYVTISFNVPVSTVISMDHDTYGPISGIGTRTLSFRLKTGLSNNQNENFTIGIRFNTDSEVTPEVVGGTMTDEG